MKGEEVMGGGEVSSEEEKGEVRGGEGEEVRERR